VLPLGRATHTIPTPTNLAAKNTGPLATAAWLLGRSLFPREKNWFVEIELCADNVANARFGIEIYAEEWGFAFRHDDRVSWIRVTDIPFVHGRDDFELLRASSGLRNIGNVIEQVENCYDLHFTRDLAIVRTNIAESDEAIRTWIAGL
jgi:hypothetical protein